MYLATLSGSFSVGTGVNQHFGLVTAILNSRWVLPPLPQANSSVRGLGTKERSLCLKATHLGRLMAPSPYPQKHTKKNNPFTLCQAKPSLRLCLEISLPAPRPPLLSKKLLSFRGTQVAIAVNGTLWKQTEGPSLPFLCLPSFRAHRCTVLQVDLRAGEKGSCLSPS